METNNEILKFPTKVYVVAFSYFKKSVIKGFLNKSKLVFVRDLSSVPLGSTLVVWSKYKVPNSIDYDKIIRVEDGFIRSAGLGVEFYKPYSLIFDDIGIYFDTGAGSRFSSLLTNSDFSDGLISRSKSLIKSICNHSISKYNLSEKKLDIGNINMPIRLVVGQVELDQSFINSASRFKSNLELLVHVREQFPESFIIYKEHPDISSGLRENHKGSSNFNGFCDLVVNKGDAVYILNKVDSVHTVSSILGFEALIRQVKVYTYGRSFYAGLGLTVDYGIEPLANNKRTLEQLVAVALILYPTYYSYRLKLDVEVEQVIDEIKNTRNKPMTSTSVIRLICCKLMKIYKILKD